MAGKAKKNNIPILKQQIKENRLQRLYVFYGEEEYLKEHYIRKITELIPDAGLGEFNRIILSGVTDYGEYDNAWEGMPMMTDRRLLVIRDSNIFTLARSKNITPPNEEQREFWAEKLKRLSDDTVVIFCEKNVDARGALFKAAAKNGFAIEFKYLSEAELKAWTVKRAMKAGLKIDDSTAAYLVGSVPKGLTVLENELNKLISYCDGVIYRSDIDRVATKSNEIKAFELIDAITAGDGDAAFNILNEMRTQNESAFGTLYLIYSNVEKMLHLKLAGIKSVHDAAAELGCSSWLAEKYASGAAKLTMAALRHMVLRVPEADYEIKTGKMDERQALEQYIGEALNLVRNA